MWGVRVVPFLCCEPMGWSQLIPGLPGNGVGQAWLKHRRKTPGCPPQLPLTHSFRLPGADTT